LKFLMMDVVMVGVSLLSVAFDLLFSGLSLFPL
jgi:hypothetical protein